jgi:sensor c-di-GMP phosphodiesterase-like protein
MLQRQDIEKPRLLDQVREKIRLKHYSIRTEQVYLDWIRRYILFHDKRHPAEMSEAEIPLCQDSCRL